MLQKSSLPSSFLLFFLLGAPAAVSAAGAPGDRWVPIHPNDDETKCLDVRGGVFENDTPVQIYGCNGSKAQMWQINAGDTRVNIYGAPFCLDAGSSELNLLSSSEDGCGRNPCKAPGNGINMKIRTCSSGSPAQQWDYTDDKRIVLQDQGLCLDLPNGVHADGSQVQTWQCTGSTDQIWTSLDP